MKTKTMVKFRIYSRKPSTFTLYASEFRLSKRVIKSIKTNWVAYVQLIEETTNAYGGLAGTPHVQRSLYQPYAPATLYPPGRFLVLISVRG
jgi:hypothetical protein